MKIKLMFSAALITEVSGKSLPVTDSIQCIKEAILCSGSNTVHISEEIFHNLERQIKTMQTPLYTPQHADPLLSNDSINDACC
jgi:hypothetical protein